MTHVTHDPHDPLPSTLSTLVVWRSGGALVSINEVNRRRARLVLEWVTVSRFDSRCGTFITVCNQPFRLTQPGHPFMGRRSEYQPKGWGVKAGMVRV